MFIGKQNNVVEDVVNELLTLQVERMNKIGPKLEKCSLQTIKNHIKYFSSLLTKPLEYYLM